MGRVHVQGLPAAGSLAEVVFAAVLSKVEGEWMVLWTFHSHGGLVVDAGWIGTGKHCSCVIDVASTVTGVVTAAVVSPGALERGLFGASL